MNFLGKTLAITGAGGFIGLRMVERAHELGLRVQGLELSPERALLAKRSGAEVIVGDICDRHAVKALCQGADIVFHTAAIKKETGKWDLFYRVNVEGCHVVAHAAREAGVRRFVHLSSVAVYGFHYPPHVTEEGPLRGDSNPYCQSKIEGEQAVMGYHEKGTMEVISIRPGDVYGPGSIWVTRPILGMKKGLFCLVDGGRGLIAPLYIDNLLDAVFLALQRDVTGEAFNVTDGTAVPNAKFFGYYAQMLGKRGFPSFPSRVLRPLLWATEKGANLLNLEPFATPAGLDFLSRKHSYSIEKATRKLGFQPRISLEDGMKRVENWLRKSGIISSSDKSR